MVMEDLPYLEISCAPETQGDAPEGLSAADEEGQNGVTNGHENSEKQRSLITFAWSKPTEGDVGYEEKVADEETKLSQDGQSSMKTQLLSTRCEKTVLEINEEEQNQKKEPDQPEERDAGSDPQTEKLQVFSPHISGNSYENTDGFCSETSDRRASATREVSEVEACPSESKQWDLRGLQHSDHEDLTSSQESTKEGSFSERNTRESTLMERGRATHPVSAVERERTMRNLVDMQRRFEEKHQRDKERQFLRVQERLAIIQNRKAEEDLLGLKNTDRLIHLTQDLPMEDKNQQKTVVRERLEQLRRERSYIMQSRRNRNTMGFKELLAPVQLHSSETEDGTN
ncbi:putative LOC107388851-like protein [Nothobranchius furzeri]|nr:putative LOC107388851-like protein [Nothobranchius furzeri]